MCVNADIAFLSASSSYQNLINVRFRSALILSITFPSGTNPSDLFTEILLCELERAYNLLLATCFSFFAWKLGLIPHFVLINNRFACVFIDFLIFLKGLPY